MRKNRFGINWLTAILLLAVHGASAQRQARQQPFQILTPNLPVPVAGQKYEVQLQAVGGKPPYHWSVLGTPLPPGFTLDADTGIISGQPKSNQAFSVFVQIADSSEPPLTYSKLLVTSSEAPLTVQWTDRPHVNVGDITGAAKVSNGSKDTLDTTVIVVAVNEIGKAFALRYERLSLAPGSETPDLKFDVSVPLGQYTVHADAVGEVPAKRAIYRDRRQAEGLVVQSQ